MPKLKRGSRACQCAACERFFTGVEAFDRHRQDGKCVDPAEYGDRMNEKGFWFRYRTDLRPWQFGLKGEISRK